MNGRIRAREVRVIGVDGEQVGVKSLGEAISLARANGVDLVEVAPNASPPVCRLVEYGRYVYEKSKRDKERKKQQNKVKEVQLSARIDKHDFRMKVDHAVGFLCDDMKVKVSLRFRGREMAHRQYGFQVIQKFIREVAPYGHPDFEPKLVGRNVNVMFSPLPQNKRAKDPRAEQADQTAEGVSDAAEPTPQSESGPVVSIEHPASPRQPAAAPRQEGFNNNPFKRL